MCGRFSLFSSDMVIEAQFDVDFNKSAKSGEMYNIAPRMDVSVVHKENPIILRDMDWGFVPHWADSTRPDVKPINTRKESLEKSMFQNAFENQRCIIPANGFYEWKKTNGRKVPYHIHLPNHRLFGFAGIYSMWKPKDQKKNEDYEPHYSFSIITCEPNEVVSEVHDRMPVILTKENQKIWMDQESEEDQLYDVLKPYPNEMKKYTVSTYVNSPRNQGKKCMEETDQPFKDPGQKGLDEFF